MLIARKFIDACGSYGTGVRFVTLLLYRRCPDKDEENLKYQITIRQKALRACGGADDQAPDAGG
jgi:hypothetical protein